MFEHTIMKLYLLPPILPCYTAKFEENNKGDEVQIKMKSKDKEFAPAIRKAAWEYYNKSCNVPTSERWYKTSETVMMPIFSLHRSYSSETLPISDSEDEAED